MATMKVVAEVVDEREYDAGWWFYLKPGWKWEGYGTHAIRRDLKKDCLWELKTNVVPCNCLICKSALEKQNDH